MMRKADLQQVKLRFGIIGNSEGLNRALDIALQVAPTDLSVLITGESGVGKEIFPQIVHQNSARKHKKYIAVNCGAIPEGTIDSELFGHEKGSFTGATGERKGYFEEADGGTIFLDEVGELPMSTQARLLRVLETGEFIKVGSSKVLKTNVRIVAATNVQILRAISNGKFREDLYYRLNTVPIQIPPLRDRKQDIYLLFRKFASDFADKYRMPSISLNEEAKDVLMSYRWPGNIRQLKNLTEQISIIEPSREIDANTLKAYIPDNNMATLPSIVDPEGNGINQGEKEVLYKVIFELRKELNDLKAVVYGLSNDRSSVSTAVIPSSGSTLPVPNYSLPAPRHSSYEDVVDSPIAITTPYNTREDKMLTEAQEYVEETHSLEDMEKEMIRQALIRNNGKRKRAADELKISERTLYRKIKDYKLDEY